jgi:hypothetical protein
MSEALVHSFQKQVEKLFAIWELDERESHNIAIAQLESQLLKV